jgi:hypothetical protein
MRVKFRKGDPRAGTVAEMDSARGQQLVDAGAADVVTEGGKATDTPRTAGGAERSSASPPARPSPLTTATKSAGGAKTATKTAAAKPAPTAKAAPAKKAARKTAK